MGDIELSLQLLQFSVIEWQKNDDDRINADETIQFSQLIAHPYFTPRMC